MANFNTIRHGSIDDLDALLERFPFDEQEIRAALQNILSEIGALRRRVDELEAGAQ